MIIVWGTKIVRKKIGRVADFCYICRELRPFRGTKIESVGHLYYIPLGTRTTVGYNRTCESCGCAYNMKPEAYQALSRDRRANLNELIDETQPQILALWEDRLKVEKRALEGRLTPDERRACILEPFLLLNYRVEGEGTALHVDRLIGLGLVAGVGLPLLSMFALPIPFRPPSEVPGQVAIGAGVLCLVFLIWAAATQTRRFARLKVLPIIAETLRPLAPSPEELAEALQQLKQMQTPIGNAVRIEDLMGAFGYDARKPASVSDFAT